MKAKQFILSALLVVLIDHASTSQAEDIDIYSSQNLVNTPNVMIVVDNASNSNANMAPCTYSAAAGGGAPPGVNSDKTIGNDQCALANVVASLPKKADGSAVVKLGITTLNGVVLPLTPVDDYAYTGPTPLNVVGTTTTTIPAGTTNRNAIIIAIKALDTESGKTAQGAELQETWAYYTGGNGTYGVVNTAQGRLSLNTYTHSSTNATSGCQKNYIIFLSGVKAGASHALDYNDSNGNEDLDYLNAAANNAKNDGSITIDQFNALNPGAAAYTGAILSKPEAGYGIEWARFMKTVDINTTPAPVAPATSPPEGTGVQSIITYSIATGATAAPPAAITNDMEKYIKAVSTYGGGKYFPAGTDAGVLESSILKILNEVQAVNSVFSSSSLPVSVNAQGTYLNQIYMGMFRPDPDGNPRWVGNLKQYHFVATRDAATQLVSLALSDSLNASAINPATGFITPNAVSYWTCGGDPSVRACSPTVDVVGGFWANDSSKADSAGLAYDLPDGEWVDKGGAAQIVRLANLDNVYTAAAGTTDNPRKLYTHCPSGAGCVAALGNSSNVFDTTNASITDAMLKTGPVTISSIASAATVQATGTSPGVSGAPATVSITAFAKSGNTVTATVSAADAAKLSVGSKLSIASSATKYNCDPCDVTAVGATTFTYDKSGGTGTPAVPYTATIYSSFATVTKASHGLSVGQTVTISNCTTHIALNGTISAITAVDTDTFTIALAAALATAGSDAACRYTPNTATVTTATSHGFALGTRVTIAGATPASYNGTWVVTPTSATTFTYLYTTAAPLGNTTVHGTATSSATTREALIRWVRGEDSYGDESGPGSGVTIRPSLHGDVLHSRPVAVNYGSYAISITSTSDSGGTRTATASAAHVSNISSLDVSARAVTFANGQSCLVTVNTPTTFSYSTTGCGAEGVQTALVGKRVVVFYGGNDGVYRAVNGNQTEAMGTVPAGGELWGFIPKEFFGGLKRLHDNSPILDLPSTIPGIVPTPQKKDYFADGSTGIYQKLNANGTTDSAYLYITMRRGGRLLYALNVTDPASPEYLWKITNTGDFTELGQTWSAPKVALIKGYKDASGNPKPVLIFGAGYDNTAEDTEPPGTDTMGRGIYIVDAVTGAMVWRATYGASYNCSGNATQASCTVAGMDFSIPADITLMDSDYDGAIDRLYAVDVGGNVWRVDLQRSLINNTPEYWEVHKVASLGGSCCPRRKFFYPADVVHAKTYDAVLVGSGDREHPLSTDDAADKQDRLFMLKDVIGNDGSSLTTIVKNDLFEKTSGNTYTAAAVPSGGGAHSPNKGYFINLLAGEKVVNAPLTVAGYTYFGTHQPTESDSCSGNLGIARGYRLDPLTGAYTYTVFAGGGLPPSPVAGVVSVTVEGESTSSLVPFVIGGGGDPDCVGADCMSALGGSKPTINVPTSRTRTYWYQEVD